MHKTIPKMIYILQEVFFSLIIQLPVQLFLPILCKATHINNFFNETVYQRYVNDTDKFVNKLFEM